MTTNCGAAVFGAAVVVVEERVPDVDNENGTGVDSVIKAGDEYFGIFLRAGLIIAGKEFISFLSPL